METETMHLKEIETLLLSIKNLQEQLCLAESRADMEHDRAESWREAYNLMKGRC